MRVGIDIRVLARGTYTGIEEYTRGLLQALIPLDRSVHYSLFYNAFNKAVLEEPWMRASNVRIYKGSIPNRILDVSGLLFNMPKIDRILGEIDVFLSPHFLLAALSPSVPRVLVIHDLSFHLHPEYFSLRKRIWHARMRPRAQAHSAARLIAVSQATAEDLEGAYNIRRDKIEVVLSGISRDLPLQDSQGKVIKEIQRRYKLPEKFFLYFGTIEPRKNIIGLVRAFERVRSKPQLSSWKLVIAGSLGWSYEAILHAIAHSHTKDKIILTGFVRKEDKPYLYKLSSCFIYPSFFEGFGFPPLEAMQHGVPTITSHVSSLPEVVGDAAILIDPHRVSDIASAMEAVATDDPLRRMLRERGIKRAEAFSWEASARRVLHILREVSNA